MEHEKIITNLLESGYFDYGATIPTLELLAHFGTQPTPDAQMLGWSVAAVRKCMQKDALEELAITSRVRDRLLGEGRYLGKDGDVYRVFLPSENAAVAKNYLASAGRKQRRAATLLVATPTLPTTERDNSSSRAAISGMRTARLEKRAS